MGAYFLGVDVGGTKSDAWLIDETGQRLAASRQGAANPDEVGYEGLTAVLQQLVGHVLESVGLTAAAIQGAGFGIAGYDWPSQRGDMLAAIGTLGLSCPVELVNDALITLIAGASAGWGVAVVAGTSCNAWGIGPDGRYGRMAGYSHLGEYAGSVEIVAKALQAITKAWTCRGPRTALTQAFSELVGASGEADLIEGVALQRYLIGPEAAPVILRVASDGDPVAQALLHWAGAELGDLALGVIRQLDLADRAFAVVLSGSFLRSSPVMQQEIERVVGALAPQATFVPLAAPPVVGAALLGMKAAGLPATAVAGARLTLTGDGCGKDFSR